jgi:hypothetical protein
MASFSRRDGAAVGKCLLTVLRSFFIEHGRASHVFYRSWGSSRAHATQNLKNRGLFIPEDHRF